MDRFLDGVSLLATLQDIPSIKPISDKALAVYESNDYEMNAETVRAIEDGMVAVEKVLGKSVMESSELQTFFRTRKESYDALERYKTLQYILVVRVSSMIFDMSKFDNVWESFKDFEKVVAAGEFPVFDPPVPAIKGSLAWIRQQWMENGPSKELIWRFACHMGINEVDIMGYMEKPREKFDYLYFDLVSHERVDYSGLDDSECMKFSPKSNRDRITEKYSSSDGKQDKARNAALARYYSFWREDEINRFADETDNNLEAMFERARLY